MDSNTTPTVGPHDVPDPDELQIVERLVNLESAPPHHPFWSNIEQRPTEWIVDWENRRASSRRSAVCAHLGDLEYFAPAIAVTARFVGRHRSGLDA
jgi:hypothetical protein